MLKTFKEYTSPLDSFKDKLRGCFSSVIEFRVLSFTLELQMLRWKVYNGAKNVLIERKYRERG